MNRRFLWKICLVSCLGMGGALLALAAAKAADPVYQWVALKSVKRIAVLPPFFCTETLAQKAESDKDRAYQNGLKLLATTMQKTLPKSLAEPKRFQIVSTTEIARALKALHWTARDLFTNKGLAQDKKWPAPDTNRIATLAKRLRVDAVWLGTMREPASIGDGMQFHHETWNPNPLNWSLRRYPSHVVSPRVQAFLITKMGVTAWRDEQMANHPRTKDKTPRTLLVDWQEATEQVAQQLTDSLMRLPPPERQ